MWAKGATKRTASVTPPTPSGMRSGRGCRWQRWTALERRHLVISALMGALGKLVAILVPHIGDVVNPGDRELQWVRGSFAAVDGRRRPMPGSPSFMPFPLPLAVWAASLKICRSATSSSCCTPKTTWFHA